MNAAPRRLPVFQKYPHVQAEAPLPAAPAVLAQWNAVDGEGRFSPCEGLGYEGGAATLSPGEAVSFSFKTDVPEALVSVRMVPTHPVSSPRLRFSLSLDGGAPMTFSYETYGRSEEWKENVLNNQAVRDTLLQLGKEVTHRLTLTALDEGVVLDQVLLCRP